MSLNFQFILKIKVNPALETSSFINLPSSVLESCMSILDEPDFIPPLTFEIKLDSKNDSTCFSVLHFDSTEDEVEVPLWFYKKFHNDQEVVVNWKPLPKGTFCKLKCMDPAFRDIKFSKEFLEAQLRKNYTCVNLGQVLELKYLTNMFKFEILELEPEPAVNLIDCDLSVEIIDASESVVIKTDFAKAFTELKLSSAVEIEFEQHFYFKFLWDRNEDFQLTLDKSKQLLTSISLGYEDNFSKENDQFACVDKNLQTKLVVEGKSPFFKKNSWFLGCITSESPIKAKFELHFYDPVTNSKSDVATDTVVCPHCQKAILKSNFELHSLRCKKDFIMCELCNLPYSRSAFESHWHCQYCSYYGDKDIKILHDNFHHNPKKCSCSLDFKGSIELSRHSYFECPLRLIRCRYCYNSVPFNTEAEDYTDKLNGLNDHEAYCGSRTITCQKCNQHVQIKKVKIHHQLHEFDKQRLPLPFNKCRNSNCVNAKEDVEFDENNLELCSKCYNNFPYQSITFDKKDFTKRLTQQYFKQLTQGCNSQNCNNILCLNLTNENLPPNEVVIKLIPFIKHAFDTNNKRYYLCMDPERNEKGLQLINLMEKMGANKFKTEWCIQALKKNDYKVEKAKVWLKLNAPNDKSKY